jgi:hypothetical protein
MPTVPLDARHTTLLIHAAAALRLASTALPTRLKPVAAAVCRNVLPIAAAAASVCR